MVVFCAHPLRWLLPLVIAVGAVGFPPSASAQAPPPARVVVSNILKQSVSTGQTYVGTVTPIKRTTVGSAVDGRLIEMMVEEGDKVAADGPLAQLLTDTVTLELQAAEAELALRRAELTELENGSRPEEIEEARSQMLAAKALMEFTAARRARNERLYEQNATISVDELQETVAAAEGAAQNFLKTKATYELAVKGPREERIAQALARVNVQESLVEQIKDRLKKHTVVSRFEGYVVDKLAEEGQWLDRGDPVAEVVALDTVEAEVYVVEQHVPFIRHGVTVRVEAPALPQEIFTGEVSAVVPQANVRTRTFPVKIKISNRFKDDQPLLLSGMYVRARLPTGSTKQGLLVPKDALVLGGPSPMVFVAVKKGDQTVATAVNVQLGAAVRDLVEVMGALSPDQWVVVEGNERIMPGQPLEIIRRRDVPPVAVGTP